MEEDGVTSYKTLDFYDDNAKKLIVTYDNAKVASLEKLFQKYITKGDTVLDIGFGSGRDLKTIQTIQYIWTRCM